MIRLTISCRTCLTTFRIVVPDQPVTTLPPKYCLYCGSQETFPTQDSDQDIWEILSEGYGLPIAIVQMLYNIWTQDSEGMTHFKDYVEHTLKTAKEQRT